MAEILTEKRDGQSVIPLRQDGKTKWALCSAGMGDASTQWLYGDAAEHLAKYEDLGTVEELAEKLENAGNTIAELKAQLTIYRGFDGCRLHQLLWADLAGRCVVLPCKVGETVYWLSNGLVKECKAHRFQQNKRGRYIVLKSTVVHGAFSTGLFGIHLFLTREDAEAKLKENNREQI